MEAPLRQGLAATAALAAAVIAFTVATRDPEQASSVAVVIVALAVGAGAAAALVLAGPRAKRGRGPVPVLALRRGAEVGVAVGLIAFLRVIDGLTIVTAAFVALAFAAAEYVLSPRRVRSRR